LPSVNGPFDAVNAWDAHRLTSPAVVRFLADDKGARVVKSVKLFLGPEEGLRDIETGEKEAFRPVPLIGLSDAPEGLPLTVVLIDTSGTMGTYSPTLASRKIAAAEKFLTGFSESVESWAIDSVFGLATSETTESPTFAFFVPMAENIAARGRKGIFRAISEVVDQCNYRTKFKRILVMTDGLTREDPLPLLRRLLAAKIALDAIVIGESNPAAEGVMASLCELTGGRAFRPETIEDGRQFVAREEFADLSVRNTEQYTQPVTNEMFREQARENRYARSLPPAKDLRKPPRLSKVGLAGSDFRGWRIAKELRLLREHGIPVYRTVEPDVWVVLVEGKRDNVDVRVVWEVSVTFGRDYPYSAPLYRFRGTPPLENVTDLGRVVRTVGYHPAEAVVDVVRMWHGSLPSTDDDVDDGESGVWSTSGSFEARCEAPECEFPKERKNRRVRHTEDYDPVTWKIKAGDA
jgi:hypothetical protein